ncbi:hypothetical protein ABZY58_26115 [Micromonospora tulbaghiae]|uniref:hypothetical protein n=1 Tax=Micromonospora tulbaghiae TaxID=479978 RepID=UPI0033B5D66E
MLTADLHLAHGYTLADLNRLARASASSNRTMAADHRDLVDAAWSAIADAIYAAEHWLPEHELLRLGKGAIWSIVRDHRQTYGYRDREWDAGLASAPRFCAYWLGQQVTPSPEGPIVERLTLPRLLAALTDTQRRVVAAVAAHDGDRPAAAAALGVTEKALNHQLRMARMTCAALWVEGETPRRVAGRRLDRRNHRGPVASCGTLAAARRHRDRREPLCPKCAPVEAAYDQKRRARR